MDFFEMLEHRCSIRAFQNRLVACETLKRLIAKAGEVYRYMNFDQIAEFKEVADTVTV